MTEEERRKFESAETLRQAAYCSFNDRRVYEWKLNLAIWTFLAVLLAGLVQPSKDGELFPLKGTGAWLSAAILGGLVILVHAYWSDGAARANAIDKAIARHYARIMHEVVAPPFDQELTDRIAALPKQVGWRQWTHLAQIAITTILVVAAVVIVYFRSS